MSKEKSFNGIYKDVTYEDILSYKRYKKLSFLKGCSPEEIAKHIYAQEIISQDKWKILKILNKELFNQKRAEAHKTKIHNNYDYLLDEFGNRRLPDGVFSESFDKGVIACVKAKSEIPFYQQFICDYFFEFNIDSIIDYAYTLPEEQKDMCKTLIYAAIQYYRDTNDSRKIMLDKARNKEYSNDKVGDRGKKDKLISKISESENHSDVPAKEVHLDMVSKPEDPLDAKERKDRIRSKDGIDYSNQQKRNQETGDIGEKLVLANEINKARKWGLSEDLVSQIRRVSLESDDYGFDILSFDQNGKEHYIEVKTTKASSNSLSFVLTQNELAHARKYGSAYSIVMVFDVEQNPRIWDMGNPFVSEPCKVNIKPIKYLVEVNVDSIE